MIFRDVCPDCMILSTSLAAIGISLMQCQWSGFLVGTGVLAIVAGIITIFQCGQDD